jgi:membrane protein
MRTPFSRDGNADTDDRSPEVVRNDRDGGASPKIDESSGVQRDADGPRSVDEAGNEGPGSDPRGRRADKPTEIPKRGWKDVLVRSFREFKSDNISMVAAAAAFYAWLALLPAILAGVMLYGILASPEEVTNQIEQLTKNLSQEVATTLQQPIEQATNTGNRGLGIGLIVALMGAIWSASGGMNGLIQGIGIAYDQPDNRNFFKKRGLAIALTLGGIFMFLLMITLIAVLPPVVQELGLGSALTGVITVARFVLLAVLMLIGLAILYRLAPDRDNPKFTWVTPGAIVAMILWLAVSAGFSFYVTNFGSYNKTYGALAGVIILELWLYLTMMIILFGAEMNAEMEAQTAKDTTVGADKPMGRREATKADTLGEAT